MSEDYKRIVKTVAYFPSLCSICSRELKDKETYLSVMPEHGKDEAALDLCCICGEGYISSFELSVSERRGIIKYLREGRRPSKKLKYSDGDVHTEPTMKKTDWRIGIIDSGYNCKHCAEYQAGGSVYIVLEEFPICLKCAKKYTLKAIWEGDTSEGIDSVCYEEIKEAGITILFDDTTKEVKTMDEETIFDETELVEEPTPDEVVEETEAEPVAHTPTVISKLKGSVPVPEEFKFADNSVFYTMLRNIFRGKSILVTGPSGCGKSSLGKILADITNKPYYAFNFGDTMNPAAKLLGDTKYNSDRGTWFATSRFVAALLDKDGAFIMLDEVTRDRTGDLANILMPVLDGQKYLAIDESDEADTVDINEGAFFYATANIGREYLGAAHDLDRAWKDRFTGGIYELEYLPMKKEAELLRIRVPAISDEDANHITDFARRIRELHKAEELSTAVSTRMCLAAAEFVVDGMSLIDALKQVCLPFYPVVGGDDSERVRVVQTIQSMGE